MAASLALLTRRTGSAESSMVVLAAERCMAAAATAEITTWLRHQSAADPSCDAALRTGDAPDFDVVALRMRAKIVATMVEHEAELSTRASLRTLYGALANYAPAAPHDGLTVNYTTLASPGSVWLLGDSSCKFDGWGVAAAEQLLSSYRDCRASLGEPLPSPGKTPSAPATIIKRANARVGVMGNPSDGFNGRTISLSVDNFWAEVHLWPSARLAILPHPLFDPMSFGSLADLHKIVTHEGTDGGVRLLLAACKRFYQWATAHAVDLREDVNVTLAYDTNIPRQVGLAGSSAILTATISALCAFHHVSASQLPLEALPSLVLSIEKEELGINAGLQDRVIQAYGGSASRPRGVEQRFNPLSPLPTSGGRPRAQVYGFSETVRSFARVACGRAVDALVGVCSCLYGF